MAKNKQVNEIKSQQTSPVVAVLGHVDHGKTTLLDAIRKTSIASRELGGITQKIGASSVEIDHEGNKRTITFIDTPGHEAFSQMRSRGAQAADVALLIVSSVDGVMPQTQESIALLHATKTPFIVVLTKCDSEEKNIQKVKGQLLKEKVLLEGSGGDVQVIEVSAKNGTNIKELLDLILLVFDLSVKTPKDNKFWGIIIESRLDEKSGPRATIIVKDGNINIKDEIVSGDVNGRVKTLIDDKGKQKQSAGMGEGIEIMGFDKVPQVGNLVFLKGKENLNQIKETEPKVKSADTILSITVVADTQGSLEAILASIPQERINIIMSKIGEITTADVLFAKSVGSIVLGFNIKIRPEVAKLAETENVLVKNYTLIYEMLDEIADVLEGKELSLQEHVLGEAKVLKRFPFEKTEVMGISVTTGRIAKGDRIRLVRAKETVGESIIQSSRQGRDQVSKIEKGQEGGVIISPFIDFNIGDVIISHR